MNYTGSGQIRVRTYTAGGALPVEGTVVKIYGTDDYNKDVKYSLITDSNGITDRIALPAPMKDYSMHPGAKESPYAVYNAELIKDGYYPKRIDNIPVFSGTNALLPIEMIPLAYDEGGTVIPNGTLDSIIYENENL
jgi:hypothetical protein